MKKKNNIKNKKWCKKNTCIFTLNILKFQMTRYKYNKYKKLKMNKKKKQEHELKSWKSQIKFIWYISLLIIIILIINNIKYMIYYMHNKDDMIKELLIKIN